MQGKYSLRAIVRIVSKIIPLVVEISHGSLREKQAPRRKLNQCTLNCESGVSIDSKMRSRYDRIAIAILSLLHLRENSCTEFES